MEKKSLKTNTIIDIAKKANVSTATVSRVINSPEVVKEDTREKVRQAIEELNYTPNALARGLIKKSTKTIGVIMQDINNIFYPSVIRGIEDRFNENNHGIFLCNTDGDMNKEAQYINSLIERRVDGIILMGTRSVGVINNQHIFKLSKYVPVIIIFDSIIGLDVFSIQNDEVQGAYNAVNYLVGLGHKKIALINGKDNYTTFLYKQTGYEKALIDNNLPIDMNYEMKVPPYESGGYEGVQKLLQCKERPTAILAASDQIAIGVYKGIYESGFKIPDDFSIIGYGGIPLSDKMYPELTTVNQFPYLSGRTAADVMVRILDDQKLEDKNITINTELILRKSCRPV